MHNFASSLGSPMGIACACLAGLVVVILVVWFIHWRTAFRSWEGNTAAALTAAGAPAWATDELVKGSQGNLAGAAAAAKTAVTMFTSPAGQAEFDTGILMSAYANPNRRANMVNVWNLLTNGASPQQVQAAMLTALQGSPAAGITPLPTPLSVAHDDVAAAVTRVQSAVATAKDLGVSALAHVHDMLNAAGQANLFPLVAAGAAIMPAAAVAGAAANLPVPAPAPVTAGVTIGNLPADHSVTVSGPTSTPAAA